MRRSQRTLLLLHWIPGLFLASAVWAQDVPAPTARPRVFFECSGPQCDENYYHTEITWVDWVREPQVAQVHVIVTSQVNGAGGREYILDFIGREASAAYQAQSRFQSLSTDSQREQLDGVAYTLALGLAQFANTAGFRSVARIEPFAETSDPNAPPEGIVAPDQVDDPWNLWTYRIRGEADFEGRQSRRHIDLDLAFNASRVTPTWKTTLGAAWNKIHQQIERTDGTTFDDTRMSWTVNLLGVYSIADHWSVGVRASPARSVLENQELRIQASPAIEYSVFPYEEATRRSLTAFYEVGPVYRKYFEETIYGKTSETIMKQALTIDFSERQPWGNASVTMSFSNYLSNFNRQRGSLFWNVVYRLTRGLNLNVNGELSRVRDQVYLAGAGLTEEQRLLALRDDATNYTYEFTVGLLWQFGSIFNNVVNNRFPE